MPTKMRLPAARNAAKPIAAEAMRSRTGAPQGPGGIKYELGDEGCNERRRHRAHQRQDGRVVRSRLPAITPSQRQISVASQPPTAMKTKGHHQV